MKRLLIATFLVILSVTIYGVTDKAAKEEECPKSTCCMKKSRQAPSKNKTDYIFWEPASRLIMIP